MLLLFITFFFINTEVWQVADALELGVSWAAPSLFFGLAAVFFLVARLGEELDDVDDLVDAEEVVAGLRRHARSRSAARDLAAGAPTSPSTPRSSGSRRRTWCWPW